MENNGGRPTAPGPQRNRSADNHVSINIENLNLAFSIQEKLMSLPTLSSECCIFRVPEKLRHSHEEAYMPRVVAIGPYHRHSQSVMQMEDHKLRYLQSFLGHNQNCRLEDYIKRIRSWEDRARSYYDKQIDLSSDEFTKMMLLDGIFAIQLFLMYWNLEGTPNSDRIFGKPWMLNDVRRDMMLLENQMPFFAIEGLFEMALGSHQRHTPVLLELTYGFFMPGVKMEEVPEAVMESEVKHFLDAIRLSYLPSAKKAPYDINEEVKLIPSVTELVAAGVKLKRGKSNRLFDIGYNNGVLEIPRLSLYHTTESYFRNLIAFEQIYYQGNSYLIDYIVFMDHLVNTPADSKMLIDLGIIENWLGNEDAAADLINSFCKDTFLWTRNAYFYSLRHELVAYCQRPYNKWKTSLKRDYCSSPWVVLSIMTAVVLLTLTVVQTACSLLSLK